MKFIQLAVCLLGETVDTTRFWGPLGALSRGGVGWCIGSCLRLPQVYRSFDSHQLLNRGRKRKLQAEDPVADQQNRQLAWLQRTRSSQSMGTWRPAKVYRAAAKSWCGNLGNPCGNSKSGNTHCTTSSRGKKSSAIIAHARHT